MGAGDKGNIGKLSRFLFDPCAPSLQLLVEAAGPAALKAFISLLPTDKKSIIKYGTGKSWLCHIKQFARDNIVKDGEAESLGLRFAFTLNEYVDIASWYLFLADIAGEFFINWTSQVYKMTNCHADPRVKKGYSSEPDAHIVRDGNWATIPDWFHAYPDFPLGFQSDVTLQPGQELTISGAAVFSDNHGGYLPCQTRISYTDTGQILDAISVEASKPGEKQMPIVWAKTTNHSQVQRTVSMQWLVPATSPPSLTSPLGGFQHHVIFTP